jgi:SAM-dependent methyltransferase
MLEHYARYYDAIYSTLKNYPEEAQGIATLLRKEHPACRRVLDVACGTGEHARLLAQVHGFAVDGVDIDERFLQQARAKHAGGDFQQADMVDFDLGRRYDAVLCLFSAIAYVVTPPRLVLALSCFRQQLATGGLVVIEPFFKPEDIQPGKSSKLTADVDGVHITRSSRSEVMGRLFRLHLDYEIDGPQGLEHASEIHDLGLFTIQETLDSFSAAGLVAAHHEGGLRGRGIYVARVG